MIPNLPTYISVVFVLIVLATLLLFYRVIKLASAETTRKKGPVILVFLIGWLLLQAVLTQSGLYTAKTLAGPPRIMLVGILPAMLTIIAVFATPAGRRFADSLSLPAITWLNTIRVAVELVLYWLFLNKAVPELITVEGRNYDILSGLTAPLVAYFGLKKHKMSKTSVLIWNLICLGLLINVVVYALLSTPTPLQRFAFDQPNIAILHIPFSWLPTFVVPVVLFGHLVSIRQLLRRQAEN